MHAAIKVLIGLILLLIGLGMFVDSVTPALRHFLRFPEGIPRIDWAGNFLIVLTGVIPIFLILLGLFIVWLELDEIKLERELRAEEKKEQEKAEKKEEKKEEKKK